jgi:hypothetical protein
VTTGWVNLLRYVVAQPAEQVLISVAQKYPWREIWNDEKVRIEFQNALRDALPGASKARTDGREFFTNFQVTVMKPDPVDDGLKEAIIAERRRSPTPGRPKPRCGRRERRARQGGGRQGRRAGADRTGPAAGAAEAGGDRRLPQRGRLPKAKAIENGQNPYQPTYVVPQGG